MKPKITKRRAAAERLARQTQETRLPCLLCNRWTFHRCICELPTRAVICPICSTHRPDDKDTQDEIAARIEMKLAAQSAALN